MRTQQTKSSGDSVSEKSTEHKSVLLHEVISWLDISKDDIVFDGTLGASGHGLALASNLGSSGVFIGTDVDSKAVERAKSALLNVSAKVILAHTNFVNITRVCKENNITHLNKALLDLGWSSDQMNENGRGLSFQKDEPLDMRLSDTLDTVAPNIPVSLTAREIVNEWNQESIADVLFGWGGERYARRIAKAIVSAREESEINTTFELVEIIKSVTPSSYSRAKLNPATRTFQALRIAVNDEIRVLQFALEAIVNLLAPSGRLAIISFHSVEDRVVKHTFKNLALSGIGEVLTKKPIMATKAEVDTNRRARSAKLRIFSKL